MTGEVIKSFLVSLGFGVDDGSLSKFNKAIEGASVRVLALYGSVKIAAAGIFYGIASISQGFEDMGYEMRIVAPAINKALLLRNALLSAYSAAGINITKVVQESIKFNMSLTKTKYALEAVYKSVGARFFPLLTKQMDIFRAKIYANMPRIQGALEKFVKFIFKSFEATVVLGQRIWSILERVYDFFERLHKATDGWSTVVIALIAAWKLFGAALLGTPFGRILTGLMALLALYDDFMTWAEGGQSLINWGSDMAKTIVGLTTALAGAAAAIGAWQVLSGIITLVKSFNTALSITDALLVVAEAPFWAIAAAIGAIIAALTLADAKWKIFGGNISGFFGGIGSKVMDFVAGANGANPYMNQNQFAGAPLGVNGGGGNTQSLSQQNNIVVHGASDPVATGAAVGGVMRNQNADMARNLKGAAR